MAGARERGVGRVPIFFADDEFNLPDERHPIAVLEGLRERGLTKHISWRAYFNPTPFSAEFAELVRETNGHVSITVDSAADALLETAQKPFRRRHLDALVALLGEHGVSADLGLIFGLPGETEETIAETIALRPLAAGVDRGRLLGRRARLSAYPARTDRRTGARAARRRGRPDVPDPGRLLAPLAAARAGAPPRRAAPRAPERQPRRRRLRNRSDDAQRRLPGRALTGRQAGLGRDPRAGRARRHAAQAGRDDRRLPPGRALARALRPRLIRGSAAPP